MKQLIDLQNLEKEVEEVEKELNNPEILKDKKRFKDFSQKYKGLKEKQELAISLEETEKKIKGAI